VDPNKLFGDVSKIPIVGEFIIGCAIYLVPSVAFATTEGFGLDSKYHSLFQYIFLAIAIAYAVGSLSFRIWKYFSQKTIDENEL